MNYLFSFIIPVYNRPKEIEELLASCLKVQNINSCEIVIVEDGSTQTCKHIIESFVDKLHISYYQKTNTGPGDSRNYGMKLAQADYFIILDSDVLLTSDYVIKVEKQLTLNKIECFGGPDKAHKSFSPVQKAINYTMTSFFTTGGIRGKEKQKKNFQPRSFNMGLSRRAFLKSAGFSNIHPGEDPDLALRLQNLGFQTALFSDCFVYHKRRVSWSGFANQVYKFGLVRPILNARYPQSHKVIFYFPSIFSLGLVLSIVLLLLFNFFWLFMLYSLYFILVFVDALMKEKNVTIAVMSIYAVFLQFFSYGIAFLKSVFFINIMRKNPENVYPFLFFKY